MEVDGILVHETADPEVIVSEFQSRNNIETDRKADYDPRYPGAANPRRDDRFFESEIFWGRLRRKRRGIRSSCEAGVPAAEVVGELVVEDSGAYLQ